jgi:hypothetical protein
VTNEYQASLLKDIYRLIVISYMFGRTATISQDQYPLLYQLHSYSAQTVEYATRCSPRMANRQLKFLFCAIFNTKMESVLKRLQQILRSSKRNAKWTSAFCALLGLAMVFEDTQNTTHCRYGSGVGSGLYTKQDAEYSAEAACRAIDVNFTFLTNLFRWKYHRGFNPLVQYRDEKVRRELGDSAVEFAKGVSQLVNEKCMSRLKFCQAHSLTCFADDSFLFERQHVSVCHQNPEKYYSRLVARYLLSFFGPSNE